ncbi:MAG: class I SAM-dependent methyltransferase, partial [Proteobacteria bacterium]|nr:class I SAM-dependent methyltransferase [Pseudomonadota bacterium]
MPESNAIQYFNDNAEALSAQYNSIDRAKVHEDLLALLPPSKKLDMLDVGAGSGADAHFFSSMGHKVVAAEPAQKLRDIANQTFKDTNISWSDDQLPDLKSVTASDKKFDVIYAVGTLQYLDEKDRVIAFDKMASLLKQDGLLEIFYPTPASREYQFSINADELTNLVQLFNQQAKSQFQLDILQQKNVKDFTGRKALNGSDLYFNTTIIAC